MIRSSTPALPRSESVASSLARRESDRPRLTCVQAMVEAMDRYAARNGKAVGQ